MNTAISFGRDNFAQRRASQSGAGVAYDPNSLCMGFEDPNKTRFRGKDWKEEQSPWQQACRGQMPIAQIPNMFPRDVDSWSRTYQEYLVADGEAGLIDDPESEDSIPQHRSPFRTYQ